MKKFLKLMFVAYLLFAPVLLLAQAVTTGTAPDVTFMTIFGDIQNGVDLAKAGSWLLFVQAIIFLICDLMKLSALGNQFNKVPPRFRLTIPVLLGAVAGIITGVASGQTWINAILGAIVYGAGAISFRQALAKLIMGKKLNKVDSTPMSSHIG